MATYYVWSGASGSANGTSWADAYLTLAAVFAVEAIGDTIYVAHDHAETTAGSITLNSAGSPANPVKVICVDRAGSVPPVYADRRATATVSTTASTSIIYSGGSAYFDGIIFQAGTTGGGYTISGTNCRHRFDNCSLRLTNPGPTSSFTFGSSGSYLEFNNTTVSFGHIGQLLKIATNFYWRNTPSAIVGAIIPTVLMVAHTSQGLLCEAVGVDFSALGSGSTIVGTGGLLARFTFIDCKFDPAATKFAQPTGPGNAEMLIVRSGASGNNYTISSNKYSGELVEETTIIRTDGASDGTTPLAWKITTNANAGFFMPFDCPKIAIWNDTVGTPLVATVEGIAASLPNDDECWLELSYIGSASQPQGVVANDSKAHWMSDAAPQASSTAVWGGSTAPFRLAVPFTPQQKGWIYAQVKVGKASSTFYIDPLVALSEV